MTADVTVFSTCEDLTQWVQQTRKSNRTLGVVPTMGALHEGHLSLARASLERCDETIVTIFVNPTQFAAGEDLDQYPKPLEADLEKLASIGVRHAFVPGDGEMYPDGFSTAVLPPSVSKRLEGEYRPTHFGGVCTVVLKLLNVTQADVAFFGQKDYQQVQVVKWMVKDLNVPTEIHVCPIIREPGGLAMSSRNIYLSDEERKIALTINQTLDHVQRQIEGGDTDGFVLINEMRQMLIDGGLTSIDYALLADAETLVVMDEVHQPAVALIAAYCGKTRLIDNRVIGK